MNKVIIAGYLRSPFTIAKKGLLASVRPDDMLAVVIKALVAQTRLAPQAIDDVIVGCSFPEAEQGMNMARMVAFLAGLPDAVPGMTINRFCGSSMEAVHIAAAKITAGQGEVYLCAGVESMSRIPMGGFNFLPNPTLYAHYPQAYDAMGKTAETLARNYHITREAQEAFALLSHQKAAAAHVGEEIIPIPTKKGVAITDGVIRATISSEQMQALPPIFDSKGTVTAATSSPLTDGAAALILCSEGYAQRYELPKLASIRSTSLVGVAPEIMGIGAAVAVKKILEKTGISLKDIDIIELNEAFATQTLACMQELDIDSTKLNLEGGALALGHPLGASGARIIGKAALLLQKKQANFALTSMCIGGGQGIATLLEKIG